jgi:hypothetical protein
MFMYVQGIAGDDDLGKWYFEVCPEELEGTYILRRLLILKGLKKQIFDGVSAEDFADMCGPAPKPQPIKLEKDTSEEKDAKKAKHAATKHEDEDGDQDEDEDEDDEEQEEFGGEDEDTEDGQSALFNYWIHRKMQPWNNFPRPGVSVKDLGKISWMVNYIHT